MTTAHGLVLKQNACVSSARIKSKKKIRNFSKILKYSTVKTCPKLPVPFYGMATCRNNDLNLFFDYTPRNESFMQFYDNEELRTTELMPIDTDCRFKCGPGFYMIGSATRNCLPLSKWDGLQTACKRKIHYFKYFIFFHFQYFSKHFSYVFSKNQKFYALVYPK